MEFILKPSKFFLEQITELSDKTKRILENKLILAKQNPFRGKRILGYDLFLFRIRFEDAGKEKRAIYVVEENCVKVLCILDRDNDYKDLKKYLKKLGY